jgi:hypothetical protein
MRTLSSSAKADDPVFQRRYWQVILSQRRWLLDAPEPVIGRRFASTRRRGMTAESKRSPKTKKPALPPAFCILIHQFA